MLSNIHIVTKQWMSFQTSNISCEISAVCRTQQCCHGGWLFKFKFWFKIKILKFKIKFKFKSKLKLSVNEKSQSQKNHICKFNKCSDRWISKEKFDSIYDLNMLFLGKEQVKQGPQGWKFNCRWMDSKRFKMTYMHLWLLSDCTASDWMHTNIMKMMTTMMMLFGC